MKTDLGPILGVLFWTENHRPFNPHKMGKEYSQMNRRGNFHKVSSMGVAQKNVVEAPRIQTLPGWTRTRFQAVLL